MDFRRFSTIAHVEHAFASPISPVKATHLLERTGVCTGAHVLDIGCGFGGWSVLAHDMGAVVTAVDPNQAFIERGLTCRPSVSWMAREYASELVDDSSQDIVLCIGSTHALGGLDAVLAEARRVLSPRGSVLIGEGFWASEPCKPYLEILGAEPNEMVSHAANAQQIAANGWSLTCTTTASQDEWDEYEGLYRSSMVRWLRDNDNDPDYAAFRARSESWYEAYLRFGREMLGFGYYIATPA